MANPEFRTRIPAELLFLIRAIAPFKNSGKDWSYSDIAAEALTDWLNRPENLKLIKEQRIDKALQGRGMSMPEALKKGNSQKDA